MKKKSKTEKVTYTHYRYQWKREVKNYLLERKKNNNKSSIKKK